MTSETTVDTTPYSGNTFKKADLENIPPRDLPFGVPKWMGTGDHGLADLDDADRMEVARGGRVAPSGVTI